MVPGASPAAPASGSTHAAQRRGVLYQNPATLDQLTQVNWSRPRRLDATFGHQDDQLHWRHLAPPRASWEAPMWLVGIGLLLFALHALDIGPPGHWNLEFFGDLWKFLVPFGLAAVWWAISDSTGLTQRRAMKQMDERKAKRRERDMRNLGLEIPARGKGKAAKPTAYRDPTDQSARPVPPRDPRL